MASKRLACWISMVSIAICLIVTSPSSSQTMDIGSMIDELRKDLYEDKTEFEGETLYMGGFGITANEVSYTQLSEFLKDKNNQEWLETILQQNWFGQRLQLFVTYKKDLFEEDIKPGKEVINHLSKKALFEMLKQIASTYQLYFLNTTLTAVSTMLTLLDSVNAVSKFSSVVEGSYYGRELYKEYFKLRKSKAPEVAFDELYQDPIFSTAIDFILNARLLK